MSYSFQGKKADEMIRDLEAGHPQAALGGSAYEIAGAALQAAVAQESRRLVMVSVAVSASSLAVAIVALLR